MTQISLQASTSLYSMAAGAAAAAQPLMLVRVNVIRKLQSAGEMGRGEKHDFFFFNLQFRIYSYLLVRTKVW